MVGVTVATLPRRCHQQSMSDTQVRVVMLINDGDNGDDVGFGDDDGILNQDIQPTIQDEIIFINENLKVHKCTECFFGHYKNSKNSKSFALTKNSPQPLILGGSSFRTLPRQPPEATKLG